MKMNDAKKDRIMRLIKGQYESEEERYELILEFLGMFKGVKSHCIVERI